MTTYLERYLLNGVEKLRREDPELFSIIESEHARQAETLSLVASSSGVDTSVLAVVGSTMVNVTAEGYPGRRYHAGCGFVDRAETLAIERACAAFGARFANVQPHCASFANHAVMQAVLVPGDRIIGLALDQGGHLTHGSSVNLSGRIYQASDYSLDPRGRLDYDGMLEKVRAVRPRLIIAGTTSYTRVIDFERIRAIADEVSAYVLADITHIAGLVAAGLHPSPVDHAHFTTTCTFKQLYGPRGGLILMGRDAGELTSDGKRTLSQAIQSAVFPTLQGSPEVHAIAAKARALARIASSEFRNLARAIQRNAMAMAEELIHRGYDVISGGTDNHMVLFRLPPALDGRTAATALESCGILVNKNRVPGDPRPASTTSGIRLGSNTVSLRGMGVGEMRRCVELIDQVLCHLLSAHGNDIDRVQLMHVQSQVKELCRQYPLPYGTDELLERAAAG